MNEPKQIIVVRTKYPDGKGGTKGLRTGKLIAQAAHASMKVLLDRGHISHLHSVPGASFLIEGMTPAILDWIKGRFTKVCVSVNSEQELIDIYNRAVGAGLPAAMIEDAGLTEFHGVVTKTCCAIGPAYPEDIDKVTGELQLL